MNRILITLPLLILLLHCQQSAPIIDPARYRIEISALSSDPREAALRLPGPYGSLLDLDRPAITNEHITALYREYSEYTGQPVIRILLNTDGRLKFAGLTRANIHKPLAIIINGVVASVPVVREEIAGGELIVTGDLPQFTVESPAKE